jgi:putative phage-type endonuclease
MNAPQGTEAWLIERAGHATASCFDAVLAKIKSGEAMTRRKYRLRLVTERLTGLPTPSFKNAAMEWGVATEPFGRMAYEAATGMLAIEAPFRKHPTIAWCGCSPDGEIEDDGLLEIKCPDSTTHVEYLTAGVMPSDYIPQVQGQMWVTGRAYCDFVSFDPRMPANLQLFRVRVERDDAYCERLEAEVLQFLDETAALEQRLRERAA